MVFLWVEGIIAWRCSGFFSAYLTSLRGQYPHAHNCRHKGGSLDSQGMELVDGVHVI